MIDSRAAALELVKGAYDLHTHSAPSHVNRDLDDFELIREADALGMAGVMIKSHYHPTCDRAIIANKYAGAKTTKAYGALALNWPVGGINPYAVEASAKMGAILVWMPTKDSRNCLTFGNMDGGLNTAKGVTIYDDDGKILPAVYDVFDVVKKHDIYLATGHLSAQESIELCKLGREQGVKMILTHPDWSRTIVPLETQLELAHMGVIVEKVWINVVEGDVSLENFMDSMRKIGSEGIYLVTDRGQKGQKHPAVALVDCIQTLLEAGMSEKEIINMSHVVPAMIAKA